MFASGGIDFELLRQHGAKLRQPNRLPDELPNPVGGTIKTVTGPAFDMETYHLRIDLGLHQAAAPTDQRIVRVALFHEPPSIWSTRAAGFAIGGRMAGRFQLDAGISTAHRFTIRCPRQAKPTISISIHDPLLYP